ncbi:MAG: thioredoxin domain-containing protein [Bdellovibrionota bacterium]
MPRTICTLLLAIILLIPINQAMSDNTPMHTNRLSKEKSPYLLQHQHNPVDWYPWGDEAFAAAKAQNKPIFLSIGYSTCYWCHVMEKDSFENEDLAKVLNAHFISIKVDREERPDVDSIYMNAVVSLVGQGGWPLSVFLTPDRKPFYGGTFFPRPQFTMLLEKVAETWETRKDAIFHTADQLSEALKKSALPSTAAPIDDTALTIVLKQLTSLFDEREGGFGQAPKFPPSGSLRLLLRIARKTGDAGAKAMAVKTLEKMAQGGIYDQLGGGFHRYSTDARWLVPHFEKMLYDNAQLAVAYLEAFQSTQNQMFASVARETLGYVLRDMTDPQGGFYSAEDAGEVGKEGEFYVWKDNEIALLLNAEELAATKALFGISASGNFEHNQNILALAAAQPWADREAPAVLSARQKLLAARGKRQRPHRDDKVLTSWNGLMISAFARGYQVLGDEAYLRAAEKAAGFIHQQLWKDGILLHRYRDGEASVRGFLDDYAFLIQGLIDLYEADFNERWITFALELQHAQDKHHLDEDGSGYFFASADEHLLIARNKDFVDGAEPSGNAVSALNLLRLGDLTLDRELRARAEKIVAAAAGGIARYPSAFATTLIAVDYLLDRSKEVAIIGSKDSTEAKSFLRQLRAKFLPNKVVGLGAGTNVEDTSTLALFRGKKALEGKTTFYICESGTCKLPTNDEAKALELVIGRPNS